MIDFKKSLHIVLFSLIVSGCSLQTSVPAASKYMLTVNVKSDVVATSNFSEKVVRIGQMESSTILNSRSIYYDTDEGRSYSYTKARWMESIPKQLTSLLMLSVTKTEIFKDVLPSRSLAKNDLILESSIYTFSQTIHEVGTSTLQITMKVRLVEQYSRNIIASKLFEFKEDGVSGDSEGVVTGYNMLTTKLLEAINRWLEVSCHK